MPDDDIELGYETHRGARFLDWSDLELEGLSRRSAEIAREARRTVARFQDVAEEVRADEHLSPAGVRAKLEHAVEKDPDLSFRPLEMKLQDIRDKLERRREELRVSVIPEADPGDARGALLEREIRETFNALDSPAKRRRFVQDAIQERDPAVLRAILAAPSSLVELTDDRREQLREELIQQESGEDLAEVERDLEALERAEKEVRTASEVLDLEIEDEVHPGATPAAKQAFENQRRKQQREAEAEAKREAAAAS